MTLEDSFANLENVLARLEAARVQLEHTDDAEHAIAILQELVDFAKEAEAELQRTKRVAETEAAAPPGADVTAP